MSKKLVLLFLSIAVGLAALLSGCGPSSEASSPQPERVVEGFYQWYLDYSGNVLADGAYRSSEYLSAGFVQKVDDIIASFDKGGYDPFLCAQDIPGDLQVGEAAVSGDTASVMVTEVWNPGTEYENTTQVTVKLQKIDGTWQITDVLCHLDAVPSVPEPEPPQAETPEETVRAFYDWYLAASAYDEEAGTRLSPLSDGRYRTSPYLTEGLVQKVDAILASFDKGGYDPFLCAQDVPESFTLPEASISPAKTTVVVQTSFPGHSFQVDVVQVDGAWKIADILCDLDVAPPAPDSEPPQMATPEETVQGFYDWYLDASAYDEGAGTRLSPLSDGRYRTSPYLTEGLVQKVDAIVAAFDKGGADPFLCAQDVPESFSLEEAVVEGDIARLIARTSFPGHGFTVALQRVDGLWKMSDVLCEVEAEQFEGWQILADEAFGFQLRYPENWTYEEAELLPPEETPDSQKALKRVLFLQPQGWEGIAPPLHIQVTEGTQEEFERLYVPATSIENLDINGYPVLKAIEDVGGLQIIRYVFASPSNENVRIVALDYLSGFPERVAGNEEVANTLQQILSTVEFTR